MSNKFTPPKFKATAFNCPHCNAYAHQRWNNFDRPISYQNSQTIGQTSTCDACSNYAIWHEEIMIYPNCSGIESPNQDLGEEITRDYSEAASILQKSPRGAAALLRLAIQKLCKQVGAKGKDINECIAHLVSEGMPKKIQQALDALRVIGNEAVHPGVLDLKDDMGTATKLFKLVNLIANHFITEPKEVDDLFNTLPDKAKESIEKRDAATRN